MTSNSRATEIPTLIRRLRSARPAQVDAARARLSIIGARAVEPLIDALEDDSPRIRHHAAALLALIQDPRARLPLMALLLDRDARSREIAAVALGRFPAADSRAALARALAKDKTPEVRIAAVRALLDHYRSGLESALQPVLDCLTDPGTETSLRLAATALLPLLKAAPRRGIVRRLLQDPTPEVARRAAEFRERPDPPPARRPAELEALARGIAADDYASWHGAIQQLAAAGPESAPIVVEEMRRRSHDPEFCARAGMALKALGTRHASAVGDALDTVVEPLPLQVLVEVAGALGDKPVVYRLKDLLDRIATRESESPQGGFDPMQRVRAKAHLELARIGSRVAIQDLRSAIADPDRRIELENLSALESIGKKDEIPLLLRAWVREDRQVRERIAEVIRAIMKRERIRRNNGVFHSLSAESRRALAAILPHSASRNRTRSAARSR